MYIPYIWLFLVVDIGDRKLLENVQGDVLEGPSTTNTFVRMLEKNVCGFHVIKIFARTRGRYNYCYYCIAERSTLMSIGFESLKTRRNLSRNSKGMIASWFRFQKGKQKGKKTKKEKHHNWSDNGKGIVANRQFSRLNSWRTSLCMVVGITQRTI